MNKKEHIVDDKRRIKPGLLFEVRRDGGDVPTCSRALFGRKKKMICGDRQQNMMMVSPGGGGGAVRWRSGLRVIASCVQSRSRSMESKAGRIGPSLIKPVIVAR